jgi:DNA repair protein RadC
MENFNKAHTPIKHWLEDDRPREKMLRTGASSLSPAELLAILINNGTKSKTAMDLARELLQVNKDSLNQLSKMSLKDLQNLKGIGPAKAVTIKAALELSVKKEEEIFSRQVISSAKDVKDYLRKRLQDETREHFLAIYLNRRNRVISHEIISSGGITGTIVDIKILVKRALEEKATAMIISHNHPSGNCRPSPQDKILTQKIKSAAELFDISVLDHVIVSDEGYYSFAEDGLI